MFPELQAKLNRNEWAIQTRKVKTGSSNFSSRLRRRSRPSCVRSLVSNAEGASRLVGSGGMLPREILKFSFSKVHILRILREM